MIIFGTRARFKTVGEGQFFCPHCQTTRNYERKQGKNYFAVYFIPLIPMGDIGEFIECQTCHRTYASDVLKFKPSTPNMGDSAKLLNTVKSRLERGYSVEYVVRDLTAEGLDREIANNVVNMAVGTARKTCPVCGLTYAASVQDCPDDKVALVPA
ncbi:MAG: zinc-ribbon domain-containing protein [bacterium]|nr:zinc-ribbon domain-containing protein [bacterium]